jgi:hypothetical protein
MRLRGPNKTVWMIVLAALILTPILAFAQIAWQKDFGTALKLAARENKFIVLDISASW